MNGLVLIRTVTLEECPWLPRPLVKGEIVYEFLGRTYGCITPKGVAISLVNGLYPFYEVPLDAVDVY